jgi:hypothetical protein
VCLDAGRVERKYGHAVDGGLAGDVDENV